jgi:hypothetical protein
MGSTRWRTASMEAASAEPDMIDAVPGSQPAASPAPRTGGAQRDGRAHCLSLPLTAFSIRRSLAFVSRSVATSPLTAES